MSRFNLFFVISFLSMVPCKIAADIKVTLVPLFSNSTWINSVFMCAYFGRSKSSPYRFTLDTEVFVFIVFGSLLYDVCEPNSFGTDAKILFDTGETSD